jgi:AraC-like DNA-binding protein/quercetin dioxygenase-like cupin family protein
MNLTDLPPLPRLIERLVQLLNHPADARLVCITARCEHGVKSVDIERPTLALVLRGAKQVQAGAKAEALRAGDLLAMAPGARLDVVNRPDAADGRYLTLAIPLCDEVLAAARLLWVGPLRPGGMDFARLCGNTLLDELGALADAVAADDEARARLAVLNLLMQVARQGFSDLLLPRAPSLAAQVRQLVAQAPARDWRSADFELALAMSGATLRRRLAEEGTPLRELIVRARLACALDLLYTTRSPVKTIAHRVGYQSVESFARRFRERYGLDASAIGNAVADVAVSG